MQRFPPFRHIINFDSIRIKRPSLEFGRNISRIVLHWENTWKQTEKECCRLQFRCITQFVTDIMLENLLSCCKPVLMRLKRNPLSAAGTGSCGMAGQTQTQTQAGVS